MTKQQPSAMRSQLSKACRWLICLGFVKIALLVALAAGFPLPELEFLNFAEVTEQNTQTVQIAQNNEQEKPKTEVLNNASLENASLESVKDAKVVDNPQGSDAVRAANAHLPTKQDNTGYLPQTIIASSEPVKPKKPEQKSPVWWNNILSLKSLPFPSLGLEQVAYAATLDTPPPPAVQSTGKSSPFAPPEQNVEQSAPTPQAVLPAGTAGPQLNGTQQDPLVPTTNPPTPNLETYTSPEDPNRMQQELARREQELLMLKKQTEQRLKELQDAEKKVQEMLSQAKDVEGSKIDTLTNMYVNMKPKQAAKAIETMDAKIAVKILTNMKPKQAGEILSYANPTKTAQLTELLSRMQLGQ